MVHFRVIDGSFCPVFKMTLQVQAISSLAVNEQADFILWKSVLRTHFSSATLERDKKGLILATINWMEDWKTLRKKKNGINFKRFPLCSGEKKEH